MVKKIARKPILPPPRKPLPKPIARKAISILPKPKPIITRQKPEKMATKKENNNGKEEKQKGDPSVQPAGTVIGKPSEEGLKREQELIDALPENIAKREAEAEAKKKK